MVHVQQRTVGAGKSFASAKAGCGVWFQKSRDGAVRGGQLADFCRGERPPPNTPLVDIHRWRKVDVRSQRDGVRAEGKGRGDLAGGGLSPVYAEGCLVGAEGEGEVDVASGSR